MGQIALHSFGGNFRGEADSQNLVHRRGSGSQATLVPAAEQQRLNLATRAIGHIERADAFWTVHFVGGDAREVDVHVLHGER